MRNMVLSGGPSLPETRGANARGKQTRTSCEAHKEVQTRLQSNFDLLEAIWEVSSDPREHVSTLLPGDLTGRAEESSP